MPIGVAGGGLLASIHERHGGAVNPASPTRPTIKSPITGAIPRTCNSTQAPISRFADSSMAGIVVNLHWDDVQPSNGGSVDITGALNSATTEWVYYRDTLTPANCGGTRPPCKIRIHTGDNSPSWAKNLNGGPLTVYSTSDAYHVNPKTVPVWWLLQTQFADLATKLAANIVSTTVDGTAYTGLEAMPFVREIAIHFATTIFVEPCQRGSSQGNAGSLTNGASNRQTFITAGLTGCTYTGIIPAETITGPDPTDAAALLYITQARWKTTYGFATTPLYFPWNPFQQWLSAAGLDRGSVVDPLAWTESVGIPTVAGDMTSLVCIGNNSGRVPFESIGQPYPSTFQAVFDSTALGTHQRVGLQTATLDRIASDFGTAITNQGSNNYTPPADTTYRNALLKCLGVLFGNITPANQGAQNYYSGVTTAGNARYVELPDGWRGTSGSGFTTYTDGSAALTAAEWITLNGYAALNPTG